MAGVAFQKGTLIWRDKIKRVKRIPFFLKLAVGAAMNWLFGISVFFGIGKIGVFGLGYGDLEKMFYGSISGPQAVLLVIAKLVATTAVYAWGGAGGIFSPTLFFGAAIGLAFSDVCGLVLHLQVNDRIALTVAGMSACLGAVVRAPITSILIERVHCRRRQGCRSLRQRPQRHRGLQNVVWQYRRSLDKSQRPYRGFAARQTAIPVLDFFSDSDEPPKATSMQ